jgi:hypothetical protein
LNRNHDEFDDLYGKAIMGIIDVGIEIDIYIYRERERERNHVVDILTN